MILTKHPLTEKWELVDEVKKNSSEEDYYQRICYALKNQKDKGVTSVISFIDIDSVAEYRAIRGAVRAKQYGKEIGVDLYLASQTLKGVVTNHSRRLLETCLTEGWLDVIGSLPKSRFQYRPSSGYRMFNGTSSQTTFCMYTSTKTIPQLKKKPNSWLSKPYSSEWRVKLRQFMGYLLRATKKPIDNGSIICVRTLD